MTKKLIIPGLIAYAVFVAFRAVDEVKYHCYYGCNALNWMSFTLLYIGILIAILAYSFILIDVIKRIRKGVHLTFKSFLFRSAQFVLLSIIGLVVGSILGSVFGQGEELDGVVDVLVGSMIGINVMLVFGYIMLFKPAFKSSKH